jgi:hypothetical protein
LARGKIVEKIYLGFTSIDGFGAQVYAGTIYDYSLSDEQVQTSFQVFAPEVTGCGVVNRIHCMPPIQQWQEMPLELTKSASFQAQAPPTADQVQCFITGLVRWFEPNRIMSG